MNNLTKSLMDKSKESAEKVLYDALGFVEAYERINPEANNVEELFTFTFDELEDCMKYYIAKYMTKSECLRMVISHIESQFELQKIVENLVASDDFTFQNFDWSRI